MVIVKEISTNNQFRQYDIIDDSLISSKFFTRNFTAEDIVEAHVYTLNNTLVYSDYNYKGYKLPDDVKFQEVPTTNFITFSPEEHLNSIGYQRGSFLLSYNIFRRKISNISDKPFFIKEISSDRTEIRLSSNILSNFDIENGTLNFINEVQSSPYYKDFLLNFGDNKIVNAVNIVLDRSTENYTILVKLYRPLPDEFSLKSSLWIVEELSESYSYQIEFIVDPVPEPIDKLRGPNFNIDYKKEEVPTSDYYDIESLFSNNSKTAYQKLMNVIESKQVKLNINYSDYSNFVHFSSAKERLLNFIYKLSLIETYQSNINRLNALNSSSLSTSVSESVLTYQTNIDNVIKKFDGYEYYLYYESSSNSWPKSGSLPPYSLYNTTSSVAIDWIGSDDPYSNIYGGQLYTASLYDLNNVNNLVYSIPEFISIDERNEDFILFMDMIGQHFDNIWVYIKGISDVYDSRNNVNKGISRDLVYYVLNGLGVKLYNSSGNDNIFDYLIGSSISGSYLPVSESNQYLVTASYQNVSGLDYNTEVLKRIYHNISYLLKSKGTSRSIKSLVTSFGIPSTILDVSEFGGSDKNNNTFEYTYDRFTYSLVNESGSYFRMLWAPLTTNAIRHGVFDRVADSIEFRFKPTKKPKNNRQSLLTISQNNQDKVDLYLDYILDNGIPSANVLFLISGSNGYISQSLTAPVFATGSDGDTKWWNVMIKRHNHLSSNQTFADQKYSFYLATNNNAVNTSSRVDIQDYNPIYINSASLTFSGSTFSSYNKSWSGFGESGSFSYLYLGGRDYTSSFLPSGSHFDGQFQELRLWSEPLSESTFVWHTLNPEAIQGEELNSAYNSLSARFTFGNNLITYNHFLTSSVESTHPNYGIFYSSGSFISSSMYGYAVYGSSSYGFSGDPSSSFIVTVNTGSFFQFSNKNNYISFVEKYYSLSPNAGYYNPVNEKIRIIDNLSNDQVLLPEISIEEPVYYTKDVHFTDVSFSPQNEINKDIISQYGENLNLDDYIGNPQYDKSGSYSEIESIKKSYYAKFSDKYNYADYIKLIQYFDGSLFKMIKDFVPARTNIQTGITIKSPILERNKIQQPDSQFINDYNYYSASIGGVDITSDSTYTSGVGDGRDFYTGELSGSKIDILELFEQRNYNPYAIPTSSIDFYAFEFSEFNSLLSNVSASVTSSFKKKLDIVDNGITYPVELQDYYYEYQRHSRPRYEGSRLESQRYNYYTEGDVSFGKTPNIDLNSLRFAFFNNISEKNINFYDKTTVTLKYLIDSSSNIIELDRSNNNLFEIQNTFKSGELSILSLFNKKLSSNQIGLEGYKSIWAGGYSYSPIIFREFGEDMYFNYLVPSETFSTFIGIKAVATGSATWRTTGNADKEFDVNLPTSNVSFFYPNLSTAAAGKFSLSSGQRNSWVYSNIVDFNFDGNIQTYLGSARKTYTNTGKKWYSLDWFLPFATGSSAGGYAHPTYNTSLGKVENSIEKFVFVKAPNTSTFNVNVNMPFYISLKNPDQGGSAFKLFGILQKSVDGGLNWTSLTKTNLEVVSLPTNGTNVNQATGVNTQESFVWLDTFTNPTLSPPLQVNCVLNNYKVQMNTNDRLRVKFFFLVVEDLFIKSEDMEVIILSGDATKGYFEVIDAVESQLSLSYTEIISGSGLFTTGSNNKTIVFNNTASLLYKNSYFIAESSSIKDYYSPVENLFEFKTGDIVRFDTFFTNNPNYYTIQSVKEPIISYSGSLPLVSSSLEITLLENVNPNEVTQNKFGILRKKEDETSVILNFNKPEGATSKGLLIADTMRSDIKKQVGNIINPIKSSLTIDS